MAALRISKLRCFYRIRFARIAPLLVLILTVLNLLEMGEATFTPKRFFEAWHVKKRRAVPSGFAFSPLLTFHLNWLEAKTGYLPAKLGCDVVTQRRGNVLSLLSAAVCIALVGKRSPVATHVGWPLCSLYNAARCTYCWGRGRDRSWMDFKRDRTGKELSRGNERCNPRLPDCVALHTECHTRPRISL